MNASNLRLIVAFSLLLPAVCSRAADGNSAAVLENESLQISLASGDASLTVTEKRGRQVWKQQVRPGFRVAPEGRRVTGDTITADILGQNQTYHITISFDKDSPESFNLLVDIPNEHYAVARDYPFLFQAPTKDWYYVQNTSGEGMLMPLAKAPAINKAYSWSGSQPWWGLTDLKRAMAARLDSFRNPDGRPTPEDRTVYAVPLRINYAFFSDGGYVRLAKAYRNFFLRSQPTLTPLAAREEKRPALSNLKDGVYLYLWGKDPAEDLALVKEMKEAGIDHGVAMVYGRRAISRAEFDGIKALGWTAGTYRMPTGNLFRVDRNRRGWPNAILTGRLAPDQFYAESNQRAWDRTCAKYQLPLWLAKAKQAISDYGVQVFYFDTLAVQLAPCLAPDHPSTIEQDEQARLELMQETRDLGAIVGSGEGLNPTWALPGLDFFEGLMSLRTYTDTRLKIPAGGYDTDLGQSYAQQAAFTLDETRRIPLYELAFHDYVAGTWNWRDSNFQSTAFANKKDLFNILYGTMPLWHIDRALWDAHKTAFVESYKKVFSVRTRIGFSEMVNHGWLTADRSVQYTDWSSGDRVIVNFGDTKFSRAGSEAIPPHSFVIERVK